MKEYSDILDAALAELRNGSSLEETVLQWPEQEDELRSALSVSRKVMHIPKAAVPEPSMRRKFLYEPVRQSVWFSWLHISRLAAASTAVLLLAASTAGAAYGAVKSLPGQPLFQLKKAAEQVHVSLVSNPVEKANLQLALAQKRVQEAEAVLSNPAKTPEQESAALQELSTQTKAAVASVQNAVTSSPVQQSNPPMVNSLAGLAKQQQQLLAKISNDTVVKTAANDAQAANQEANNLVKVVAASNRDTALTALSSDPDSVSILGTLDEVNKSKITVEHTSFSINEKTVIQNSDGAPLNAETLHKQDKVQILGKKFGSENILAIQVTLINPAAAAEPEIKGVSTTSPDSQIPKATTSAIMLVKKPEHRPTSSSDSENKQPDSYQDETRTIGTFIPEDPSPQYIPAGGEN